jgi:conjugative relaxase-like TrwC/TraI family protein
MFTGIAQKNKAVATVYFDEHLSHNDYYTQGEVEVGRWIGEGAQRLALMEGQAVEREAFMDLCDNLNPLTTTRLTQRLNSNGNRRVFFDFTCSAPKSISIMAVTMGDARIVEAHQLAARFALKELERFAAARIRTNGSQQDRETGNIVAGEFLHDSSRALDPQLHTHFTIFNATFDPAEQRWKALQTDQMFDATQLCHGGLPQRSCRPASRARLRDGAHFGPVRRFFRDQGRVPGSMPAIFQTRRGTRRHGCPNGAGAWPEAFQ